MRRWTFAVPLLMVLVLLAPSAMAGVEERTRTLAWSEYIDVEIDNTRGRTLTIEYDVNVTSGVPVNVYFMDESGHDAYVQTLGFNLTYDSHHSKLRTMDAHDKWTLFDEGLFYVVIDNTGYSSMDNATVKYKVSWTPGGLWGFPTWCWVIVIIIIILLVAGYMLRTRGLGEPSEEEEVPGDDLVPEGVEPGAVEPMEGGGTAGTMPPLGTHAPVEGVAELGPQPEPPDMPEVRTPVEGQAELGPQPEPPDMPEVRTPVEGYAELSPQPEPPDMPEVRTPVEGGAELGPQPEPPDMPEVRTPVEGQAELGPQPEPPDMPARGKTPSERSPEE